MGGIYYQIETETKDGADLKIETKLNVIGEEIKDNAIRMFSVQSKALKGHEKKL